MKTLHPRSTATSLRTLFPAGVFKKSSSALLLACGLSLLASQSAVAQSTTWSNGAGTFIWDTTSDNWIGNTTWASGTAATFGSTGAGTVTIAAGGVTAGTMTVSAPGYDFTGGPLTLTASSTLSSPTEFDVNITTGNSTTSVILNINSTVTFTGGGTFNSTLNTTVAGGGTADFTSGAYAFGSSPFMQTISGEGTLALNFSGNSTFSAPTGSSFILGYLGSASLVYSSTGSSSIYALLIGRDANSSLTQQAGTISLTSQLTVGETQGTAVANGALNIQGGTMNVAGTVFVGNYTTSSNTTIGSGTVTVEGNGTLIASAITLNAVAGAGNSTVTLAGNGTINTNYINQTTSNQIINLNGGTLGTYTIALSTAAAITLGGNVTFNAATAANTTANITLSGVLSGTGGFNVAGLGTVTISGTSNTFTGNVNVNAGTLAVSGNLGAASTVTVNGGALTLSSATALASTTNLVFASTLSANSITLNFSGTDMIATLSLNGGTSFVATGTYTASDLNTLYGTGLFTGSGNLNVTGSAIPEPATYGVLAGLGALGLAIGLRRRRRKPGETES